MTQQLVDVVEETAPGVANLGGMDWWRGGGGGRNGKGPFC